MSEHDVTPSAEKDAGRSWPCWKHSHHVHTKGRCPGYPYYDDNGHGADLKYLYATQLEEDAPELGHVCTSGETSGPHRCSCGGWFDTPHQHTSVLPPGSGRGHV